MSGDIGLSVGQVGGVVADRDRRNERDIDRQRSKGGQNVGRQVEAAVNTVSDDSHQVEKGRA